MTTKHDTDKQKELQAFWDAEKAFFDKILYVIRAIFSNLANIADIVNRYAGITGMLASGAQIVSMLPAAFIGPLATLFNLVITLSNNNVSIANKLVGLFTASGSSGASIAALFLHSIALPLIVVSASLGLIKESWGLGELLYRRFAKSDNSITSKQWFDAVQGVVLATLSVVAASLLFFPPAIPIAYAIFAAVGVYRFLDSIGKNPIKMICGLYKEENNVTDAPAEASTMKIKAELAPEAKQKISATDTPCVTVEAAPEKPKQAITLKTKSRFSPNYFGSVTVAKKEIVLAEKMVREPQVDRIPTTQMS